MPFNIHQLAENNPWWTKPDSIELDKTIAELRQYKIQWNPGLGTYMPLDSEDYVFYTIRGPRQVGKTTFVKQMIWNLIRKGVPPDRIFFWPCDEIRGERDLTQLVDTYIHQAKATSDDRIYVFLDEITSVKNWQNSIKNLCDTGKFKTCSVILNGSHALDIRKGSGELAGRTGKNPDPHKTFVPMKFSEYVKCTNPELWSMVVKNGFEKGESRRRVLLDLMYKRAHDLPYSLVLLTRELDLSLDKYMLSGGVPRALNDLFSSSRIEPKTFGTYVEALRGDLNHWDRDNWIARELLKKLVGCMGSLVSWNDIAKEVGSTQPTISDYVWTLEQCFVVIYFHRTIDLSLPDAKSVKGKKIYFEDPFLFHAIRSWLIPSRASDPFKLATEYLSDTTNQGHMVENIVANHLVRLQFNMHPSSSFQYNQNLFYAIPDKKKELDFIFHDEQGIVPIEVRFQSSISSWDQELVSRVASRVGTRGILVTRNDVGIDENCAKIPASLFLLLI